MTKKLSIELHGLRFLAYHGVLEQERKVGNTFVVDICLGLNKFDSLETDALEDTLSYADVYDLIKKEMEQPSKLLEHIANRCATAILMQFPIVSEVQVRLTKMHPPMKGDLKSAIVELCLSR